MIVLAKDPTWLQVVKDTPLILFIFLLLLIVWRLVSFITRRRGGDGDGE